MSTVDLPRETGRGGLERRVVCALDPLTDDRWPAFVARHPGTSVFQTREWLEALRRTYGYAPVVYTTTEAGPLENGVVLCRVKSWLTGKRLVSLPFSDHCQPLASGEDLAAILEHLQTARSQERLRYVELRPLSWETEQHSGFSPSATTSFQKIDLKPELNTLYRGFHDSCIRRKIKRAEKEGLVYESGRSERLLEAFRALMLLTRRRHKLPPQPAAWFRNLVACLGDQMEIHLVSKGDVPAASILTLRHKQQVTYKYGCSDAQFNNLGGTPLLFWRVIQQAKAAGAEELDLGRSDYSDPGLIAFKEHLGATTTQLTYYRNPDHRKPGRHNPDLRNPDLRNPDLHNPGEATSTPAEKGHASWAREMLARLPDSILTTTGELLYRHIG